MEKTETLKNGILFLAEKQKYAHSVTCGIYVKAGTDYETERQLGISHLLEHMIFRGGRKLPQKDIYEKMNDLGTSFRGETSFSYVHWHIQCMPECCLDSLNLFVEILNSTDWEEAEFNKEKQVVRRQIDLKKEPSFSHHMLWTSEQNKRKTFPVMGEDQTLEAISLRDLLQWKEKIMRQGNVCCVLTGNYREEEIPQIMDLLEQIHTVNKPPLKSKERKPPHFVSRTEEDWHFLELKDCTEFDLSMVFDINTERFDRVMANHLCWETGVKNYSYLWRNMPAALREKSGLMGTWHPRAGYCQFQIEAALDKQNFKADFSNIIESLRRLKEDAELTGWQDYRYAAECLSSVSREKNWQLAENAFLYAEENGVGETDCRKLASGIFRKENLSIVIIYDPGSVNEQELRGFFHRATGEL